ncbi:type II 3-dehydroquinate dehydratase [Xylophilus rhododendri]|uniref:3-dehydroquinate dehydratase n=1 Tax=Xylophilus rhododendri TaxID=2697032 RepID=A0A857IYT7_9BURK|nr:type II 3-dehydroquinate dehydratase [Xylophilus rhododendri]QHI96616.1 type II 3-dehydroquinate dehydratase [Xylophilus rhododendri]
MTQTVLVLNGPNLNLLGTREPGIYGAQTLDGVRQLCEAACRQHGLALDFRQSNHEGQLVDWLQEAGAGEAGGKFAGTVLNAAAYTHTSVALRDAIKGAGVSVVELHISNVHAREEFRHHSYLSAVARGVMFGFGTAGYALAIAAVAGWATGEQKPARA